LAHTVTDGKIQKDINLFIYVSKIANEYMCSCQVVFSCPPVTD